MGCDPIQGFFQNDFGTQNVVRQNVRQNVRGKMSEPKVGDKKSEPKEEVRLRFLSRWRIDIEACLSAENCLRGDI